MSGSGPGLYVLILKILDPGIEEGVQLAFLPLCLSAAFQSRLSVVWTEGNGHSPTWRMAGTQPAIERQCTRPP